MLTPWNEKLNSPSFNVQRSVHLHVGNTAPTGSPKLDIDYNVAISRINVIFPTIPPGLRTGSPRWGCKQSWKGADQRLFAAFRRGEKDYSSCHTKGPFIFTE